MAVGGASASINLSFAPGSEASFTQDNPDTDAWYVKPFWRKVWGSMNGVGLGALGATTFYGEYGRYNDQFAAGTNLCSFGQAGGNLGDFCAATNTNALLESTFGIAPGSIAANGLTISNVPGGLFEGAFVTSSEVQR